jgi:AcrR family transcriptional regulator
VSTERPRTKRDEQRERTREDLLDAARVLFARHGFNGASVDQIAETAGFTKGAVYSNFDSKEELFLALLERQLDRSVAQLEALLDQNAPAERASAFVEGVGDLPVLDHDWFLLEAEFLLYAARNPDVTVRDLVADRQQRTRARITELVRRHLDDVGVDADAESVARMLMALADGLTQAALVDETARDHRRILAFALELVARP